MKSTKNNLRIFLRNADGVYGTRPIDAAYHFRTEDGKMLKRVLSDTGAVNDIDVEKQVKKMPIELNKNNGYSFEVDVNRTGIKAEDIKKWAQGHPDLGLWDDNSGTDYIYSFDDDVVNGDFESDDEKFEVFQKYSVLDADQRNAIAVYFGVEPWDSNEKELRNALVGFDGGIIATDKDARQDFLSNLDVIFDNRSLNFQSAVMCGVVGETNDGVYTLNGEVLGSSRSASIGMLIQRPELFSIIERELKKNGKFIYINAESQAVKKEQVKAASKAELDAELADLGVDAPRKPGRPIVKA